MSKNDVVIERYDLQNYRRLKGDCYTYSHFQLTIKPKINHCFRQTSYQNVDRSLGDRIMPLNQYI